MTLTMLLQVAFHDLVLSLDGEGGWAVYPGKRAQDAGEESSNLEMASSGSMGARGALSDCAEQRPGLR